MVGTTRPGVLDEPRPGSRRRPSARGLKYGRNARHPQNRRVCEPVSMLSQRATAVTLSLTDAQLGLGTGHR